MRVLLLANGASIHTARWVSGLSEAGVDVILVTQHRNVLPLPHSVVVYQLPFTGPLGYFLNGSALKRICQQEQPGLVHAHYASGYGTTARLCGRKPLLLSVWGSDVYHFPGRSPLHRWWLRRNLSFATHLASTSEAMADQVRRLSPHIKKLDITPFGVDPDVFTPAGYEPPSSGEEVVIGTIKALKPVYGVDILIESFARLRVAFAREGDPVANRLRLRIIGDGPQKEFLQQLARMRGIDAVTEFRPSVPHSDVPSELRKLHIYAALSREESFGVAILEAGACGLPVVVSDAGGLPEVVVHDKTGLVIPKECPDAAADALKTLVLNSELRRALGRAARDHVQRDYSWSKSIDRMLQVYERVVSSEI